MFEFNTWIYDSRYSEDREQLLFTDFVINGDGYGHDEVLAFDASKGRVRTCIFSVMYNMDHFTPCIHDPVFSEDVMIQMIVDVFRAEKGMSKYNTYK